MPGRRMNTRAIKEVLRLKSLNFSLREISRSVNIAKSSVHDLVRKAEDANIGWPLPEDIDDEALERLLYPEPVEVRGGKVVPQWSFMHRGTQAPRGNETTALGGVRRTPSRRPLQLLPVLRALRCLAGEQRQALDEAAAQGGGEVLCGLRRADSGDNGSANGEAKQGPYIRRGSRSFQLHLCRGRLLAVS